MVVVKLPLLVDAEPASHSSVELPLLPLITLVELFVLTTVPLSVRTEVQVQFQSLVQLLIDKRPKLKSVMLSNFFIWSRF